MHFKIIHCIFQNVTLVNSSAFKRVSVCHSHMSVMELRTACIQLMSGNVTQVKLNSH